MTRSAIIGDLALIEPGCILWSARRHHSDTQPEDGGVVYDITDAADADTGEIERLYHCASVWRGTVHLSTVRAVDVDRGSMLGPSSAELKQLVRRAAGQLCDCLAKRRLAPFGRHDRLMATVVHRLMPLVLPAAAPTQPAKEYAPRPVAPVNVSAMVD